MQLNQNKKVEKEARIQLPFQAVNDKTMSYEEASKCFNVPKSTIHDRAKGKCKSVEAGASRKMSQTIEVYIVNLLKFMSDNGFSLKRSNVLIVFENYLNESEQTHLFKDVKATKKWYSGFMKKYENEIRARKASGLQAIRAVATQSKIIDDWFDQIAPIYLERNLNKKPF